MEYHLIQLLLNAGEVITSKTSLSILKDGWFWVAMAQLGLIATLIMVLYNKQQRKYFETFSNLKNNSKIKEINIESIMAGVNKPAAAENTL